MRKILGGIAFAVMVSFLLVLPVQAYIIYFDLADPVTNLIMVLLIGPVLAITAGIGQKMKTG
jgi:hypothetical protein